MENKPKVLKSIFLALISFVVFYLSYLLVYLLIGGAITLLSKLPVVGFLIDWMFSIRGDTPDMALSLLCPIVSFYTSYGSIEAMSKNQEATTNLSAKILGVLLVSVNVISVIINLLYGEGILKNICVIIAGILIFSSAKKDV